MVIYSINDIEELSGVKAHTIRIWEKRYGIIPNRRSENNVRYYLEDDLQRILNIAHLNKKGHKISKIAELTDEQIKQKVADYCEVGEVFEDQIDGLTLSLFELNEYKFLKILNHHIESKGFECTMEQIIYPFLDKLAMMWSAGSIRSVHESFVTNIIRRKVVVEIDKLPINLESCATKYLIYLPEQEDHELSLLFLLYVLRKNGARVLYLGSNVPLIDVIEAYKIFKPQRILTLINEVHPEIPLQTYINELIKHIDDTVVGISGCQAISQKLQLPENVLIFKSLDGVKNKFCKKMS